MYDSYNGGNKEKKKKKKKERHSRVHRANEFDDANVTLTRVSLASARFHATRNPRQCVSLVTLDSKNNEFVHPSSVRWIYDERVSWTIFILVGGIDWKLPSRQVRTSSKQRENWSSRWSFVSPIFFLFLSFSSTANRFHTVDRFSSNDW